MHKDILCNERVTPHRIQPQNIVCRLYQRERGGGGNGMLARPGTDIHRTRDFYKNIFPNLTVINVEKRPGFLRKFSPDGKYLVAFTFDQTSLEIYRYNGVVAAAQLLGSWKADVVPNTNTELPYAIRSQIFDKLFERKYTVSVATSGKQLNRECSLFTNDSRFVIVGAAMYIVEENRPSFYDLYTTNDGVTPTLGSPLEDYILCIIDIRTGQVTDQVNFKNDKIFLSNNQGLYLYKNTLAVLSVQHQTIYVYDIFEGQFITTMKIGRFCNDEEVSMYNNVHEFASQPGMREGSIGSLKHRLLTFLWRMAMEESDRTGNAEAIRKFYHSFDQYKQLRMWRIQLLDENMLLIKYASEAVVTLKAQDPNSQQAFFVIYNICDSKILAVYDNTSEEFLNIFENYTDNFRNTWMHHPTQLPCSPNNNYYARMMQYRSKKTIISARGGIVEATMRILAQLPICAQCYSNSPYLDLSLFSYDDKWVSIMERPKACGEYPISFFARDSGLLKFRIHPGLQDRRAKPLRRLVAFTFHPTEPFAISVQRIDNDYVVNFHIRHSQAEPFE